jgi:hypothetical protein
MHFGMHIQQQLWTSCGGSKTGMNSVPTAHVAAVLTDM